MVLTLDPQRVAEQGREKEADREGGRRREGGGDAADADEEKAWASRRPHGRTRVHADPHLSVPS